MLTPQEIRDVVRLALLEDRDQNAKKIEEDKEINAKKLDDAMLKTVSAILTSFGMEEDERKETAKDIRFLRGLRLFVERFAMIILTTAVSIIMGGIAGVFYLGFQAIKAIPK